MLINNNNKMKNEKSCSLCCIENSLNKKSLCNDCFKIRHFILHHGKDILLNFISSHPTSKTEPIQIQPTAPIYRNQF